MFTQKEAEDFVKFILSQIFADGPDESLRPNYTNDFVGHYLDDIFYFSDLKTRIKTLKAEGMECDFIIENVVVSGNFINSICNVHAKRKNTHEEFTSKQVTVWLMQGKQIKESWIIMEKDSDYFQQINPSLGFYSRKVKLLTEEEATSFVKKISDIIFIDHKSDVLVDFLAPNFVGYYDDTTYSVNDLNKVLAKFISETPKCNVEISTVELIGDYINIICDVYWEDSVHQKTVHKKHRLTWFIEDRKIKVSWSLVRENAIESRQIEPKITPQKNKLIDMFTEPEAKEFFSQLNQDIFIDGRLDLMLKYYSPNFVGHINNTNFGIKDLEISVVKIRNKTTDFNIKLEKLIVRDNFITLSSRISYFSKPNGDLHEASRYNTFLMEDGVIKESWLMFDKDIQSYDELNESIGDEKRMRDKS